MELFHIIESGNAILCSRGVYRQSKIFRQGKDIYAGFGSGFVKLYSGKGTSHPKVSWLEIEGDGVGYNICKQPTWISINTINNAGKKLNEKTKVRSKK